MFESGLLVDRYLFIITLFTICIKSIVPSLEANSNAFEFINLETSSNVSQFVHLENLIGSVHRYAPKYVHIFVRDMGLSKVQHMLLKRYQNVKVVSSTYIIPGRTRYMDVDNELILIDGKYDERRGNGELPYVDSIRKRLRLAIVVPFVRSQISTLVLQLNLSTFYTACKNLSASVDLIFYHNEGQHSSLHTMVHQIEYVNKCYRKIRYIAVNLTAEKNWYPLGSFVMWQKLFMYDEDNDLSLRAQGYTHFFLMEPDTRPIRQFWIDAIINEITNAQHRKIYFATNWWMSGSVYRGTKLIGQRFLHINGNALYHLSSSFISHIQSFSRDYMTGENLQYGYDLALFSFLLDNQKLGKRFWHKFRFSDFIQNCWHTGCEGSDNFNNTQFILNNPDTYLIHGRFQEEADPEQPPSYIKRTLLPCVLLIFFILWHCRKLCRRSVLKRTFMFFSFVEAICGNLKNHRTHINFPMR